MHSWGEKEETGAGDLYDGLSLLSSNWMDHWSERSRRRACMHRLRSTTYWMAFRKCPPSKMSSDCAKDYMSILLYFTLQVQLNMYGIDVGQLNLLHSRNIVDLERGTVARPQTNDLQATTAHTFSNG